MEKLYGELIMCIKLVILIENIKFTVEILRNFYIVDSLAFVTLKHSFFWRNLASTLHKPIIFKSS